MKSASSGLIALMDSRQFRLADLFTFTLKSGTVLRYTNLDMPIVYGGQTFTPMVISRTRTRIVTGVEVDTMTIKIAPGGALVGSVPFLQSVMAGALDGAVVKVERAYMGAWGDTTPGALHLFEGEVSDTELDGIEVTLRVWSMLALLNIKMPRNVFQAGCVNTLYGSACGVSKAGKAVPGTAQAGSSKEVLLTALAQAAGYFTQGIVTFNSGANAGATRTIKLHESGGTLTLAVPLTYTPAAGDSFTAYPGCDKTLDTCTSRFANQTRFRGFPWIPVPETAY